MTYPVGQPLHDNSHRHVGIDDAFCDGHARRALIRGDVNQGRLSLTGQEQCDSETHESATAELRRVERKRD